MSEVDGFHESLAAAVMVEIDDFKRNRADIEQAKGILIQWLAVDADQAFAVLVRYSQDHNVRVRHLAQRLVDLASRDQTPPKRASSEQVASMLTELVARPSAEVLRGDLEPG